MSGPVEIFFCYAHEDEALMNEVRRQLVIFDRQGEITKWHDRQIPPGAGWKGQIDFRLRLARVILLFVSPDFFDSDYCFDIEMQEALKRHDAFEATVIPIIVRPCAWRTAPFGRLQALPLDGKAITTWTNRDEACLNVAEGVMSVVRQLESGERTIAFRTSAAQNLGTTQPEPAAQGIRGKHAYDWSTEVGEMPLHHLAVRKRILYEEHSLDPSFDRAIYKRNMQVTIPSKPFRTSPRGFVQLHSRDYEWVDPRDRERRILEGIVWQLLEDGRVLLDEKYGLPVYAADIVDVFED